MVPVRCGCRKMDDNTGVNAAILERLEKVVQSLQENSVKMGELLAVHNEKLDNYSVEKSEADHKKFLVYYEKLNNFDEAQLPDSAKLNLEVAKFAANIEKRGFENCIKKRRPARFRRDPIHRPGDSRRASLTCTLLRQETAVQAAAEALFEILAEQSGLGSKSV